MAFIAAAIGIGTAAAGIYGANKASSAQRRVGAGAGVYGANKASSAQRRAAQLASRTANATFDKQTALQEPFRVAGVAGTNELARQLGVAGDPTSAGYGDLNKTFGMADFNADPGYGFRLSEGMRALEHTAAARGGLLSGNALKGTERFAQGLASDEYMNAFQRYQTQRQARLGALQSLAGVGQASANTMTGAAGNLGANLSENAMAAGAARASGYVGATNAINSGIGQYQNYQQGQQLNAMLNNYYGGMGGGGGATAYDPFAGQGIKNYG